MKTRKYLNLIFGLLASVTSACTHQIGTPQPFSADYSMTIIGGDKTTGKLYFAPPKMRIDVTSRPQKQSMGPFGGNMTFIMDSSTQVADILVPQMQIYVEVYGNSSRIGSLRIYQADGAEPAKPDAYSGLGFMAGMWLKGMRNFQTLGMGGCPPEATCHRIGSETVNGRDCDKYEVTNKNIKSTMWIDQKLSFPVKIQTAYGAPVEYTNIKEGAPDPSLFKAPSHYHVFIDSSGVAGTAH